jgi:hypothetical protein
MLADIQDGRPSRVSKGFLGSGVMMMIKRGLLYTQRRGAAMIDDVIARPPDLPHQGPAFFVRQGNAIIHVLA